MAQPQTMTSAQKIPVGVTLLDQGGEVYPTLADLPAGTTVTIESSDPSVVGVTMHADGLNADLTSDNIGTAQITITVKKPDGSDWPGSPDVTDVTVVHADPGSVNVTFGAPVPETPPAP